MPRAKEYHGARGSGEVIDKFEVETNSEPSCEELKAMWRFSKRQSRAAEITNEIPTYRDPFSYNIWDPYFARTRSGGGLRAVARGKTRPVYGIMIHKPNSFRVHDVLARDRAFEDFTRYYGISQPYDLPRRGKSAVRLVGGGISIPQSGSFQHLKELIRTERARELQEQRMSEEIAAKIAAATNNKEPSRSHERERELQQNLGLSYMMNAENEAKNEAKEKAPVRYPGVLVFPNLLSPTTRHERGESISRGGQHDDPMDYYHQESYSPHRTMYRRNFYTDDLTNDELL